MKAVKPRAEINEIKHVNGVLKWSVQEKNIVIERQTPRDRSALFLDENGALFIGANGDFKEVGLPESVSFFSETLENCNDSQYGEKFAAWCRIINSGLSTARRETPEIAANDAIEGLLEKIAGNEHPDTFGFKRDFSLSPTIELPIDRWIDLALAARQSGRTIGDEIAVALRQ